MARLFVPAPTDVLPEVLAPQTQPMNGHRSQAWEGPGILPLGKAVLPPGAPQVPGRSRIPLTP